jgi:hypothetical protein
MQNYVDEMHASESMGRYNSGQTNTGLSLCPISSPQKLLWDCENISFSLHKYWLWAGALIFKLEGTLEYHEEMER